MLYRFRTAVRLAIAVLSTVATPVWAEAVASHVHEQGAHHAPALATIRATLAPDLPLKIGEAAILTLSLLNQEGKPVLLDELRLVHTEKLHLLIIDPSLNDYQHAHPAPGATPGSYTFAITPRQAGDYRVFIDLLPEASGRQEYAITSFRVAGPPGAPDLVVNNSTTVDGYRFTLQFAEPPRAGQPGRVRLSVAGADGQPFSQLQPVMGAFAHMVGFNLERSTVVHLHPLGREPETATERGGPHLDFMTDFAMPGYQKLFAQVQVDGRPVFAAFGVDVAPATAAPAAASAGHEHHHGHD